MSTSVHGRACSIVQCPVNGSPCVWEPWSYVSSSPSDCHRWILYLSFVKKWSFIWVVQQWHSTFVLWLKSSDMHNRLQWSCTVYITLFPCLLLLTILFVLFLAGPSVIRLCQAFVDCTVRIQQWTLAYSYPAMDSVVSFLFHNDISCLWLVVKFVVSVKANFRWTWPPDPSMQDWPNVVAQLIIVSRLMFCLLVPPCMQFSTRLSWVSLNCNRCEMIFIADTHIFFVRIFLFSFFFFFFALIFFLWYEIWWQRCSYTFRIKNSFVWRIEENFSGLGNRWNGRMCQIFTRVANLVMLLKSKWTLLNHLRTFYDWDCVTYILSKRHMLSTNGHTR